MDVLRKLQLIVQQISDADSLNRNAELLSATISKIKELSHNLAIQESKVKINIQDADKEYHSYVTLLTSKPNLQQHELTYHQYKYIAISPLLLKVQQPFLYFLHLLKTQPVLNQKSLLNVLINYNLNYDSINNTQ